MSIGKVIPAYWYRSSNFGDCLAPYLVEKISGHKPVYIENSNMDIEHIALIGSLLDTARYQIRMCGDAGLLMSPGIRMSLKKYTL